MITFFDKSEPLNLLFAELQHYNLASSQTIIELNKYMRLIKKEPEKKDQLEQIIILLSSIRQKAKSDMDELKIILQKNGDDFNNIIRLHPQKVAKLKTLTTQLETLEQEKHFYAAKRIFPFAVSAFVATIVVAVVGSIMMLGGIETLALAMCVAFAIDLICIATGGLSVYLLSNVVDSWASEKYDQAIEEINNKVPALTKEVQELTKGVEFLNKNININQENLGTEFDAIISALDDQIQLYQAQLDKGVSNIVTNI